MKNEFVLAFNEVLQEKQLPREVIMEALEAAMVSAYRRAVNASNAQHVEAKVDTETGKVIISAEKEVVDVVQDPRTEVTLEEAKKFDPEAEREAQLEHFSQQLGEILSGVVQAVNSQTVTLGLDMKAEGIMPRNQQIPGERFRVHDRVRALLLEVKSTSRGPQIILSRAHPNFLRRLLENEVPEIYHGLVEIRSIAREPGQRSKVAVAALQAGVDPVGACVGVRGVRIQAIVRELSDEKIDVIEWNSDVAAYIAKALSPARVNGVYLNEFAKGTKTATVVVPEDQLSLAIGRDGQNARLAAKLTSWRIDIKSLPEAATDALYKLQNQPEFAAIAEEEEEEMVQIEAILAKKSEGRPVMPEEYQSLSKFVDRVENSLMRKREQRKKKEAEQQRIAEAQVPDAAYELPVEETGISLRFANLLGGAGYTTLGDLMLQMNLDPDEILGMDGIGPKAMEEIEEVIANATFPEEAVEEVEAEEAEIEEVAEPAEPEAIEEAEAEPEEAEIEEELEPAVEGAVAEEQIEEPVEAEPEEVEEPEVAAETEGEPEQAEEGEEEDESLEELFTMQPEFQVYKNYETDDEEEEELGERGKKKSKKKKKKYVRVEYDPDEDIMVVKKKRKRQTDEWEQWDLDDLE
jgi:N utilization substance protein A